MLKILKILSAAICIMQGAHAEEIISQELVIENAWIKDTPMNHSMTSGYLTIHNTGNIDEKLIGVSSPIASNIEIHQIIMEEDIMKMRPLSGGLIIPADSVVHLEPGSIHLMFIALKKQMIPMQTHFINLAFLHSGIMTIEAIVKSSNDNHLMQTKKHEH